MKSAFVSTLLCVSSCLSVSSCLTGSPASAADIFQAKIEPVLKQHCFECHSHATGVMKGGLTLDSQSGWSEGGDSGPAIVPGKPEESLLLAAIRHESLEMPPNSKLDDAIIEDFVAWIKQGAPDPRVLEKKTSNLTDWWSLKPLIRPYLPENSSPNPVDHFIHTKLLEQGVQPSPQADRATLIRRLTFDLHGLPPTPEEVGTFVIDADPLAYEHLVDRLLASPRYGERFARHWLDVVHYGESNGFGMDRPRLNAWPYRDYLIQAFNDDRPYARFVQEQLAADALFPDEPQLIPALGFIAGGPFNQSALVEQTDGTECKKIALNLDRDDMLTNVSSSFLSVTLHCARCHQHKFDAISQKDYYRMQSVFAGIVRGEREYDATPEIMRDRLHWRDLRQKLDGTTPIDPLPSADLTRLQTALMQLKETLAQQTTAWTPFVPAALSRHAGTTIVALDDKSLQFTGDAGTTDTYTFTARIPEPKITALRIEVLTDETLPKSGPGRTPANGNFHLTEVELTAAALDAPEKPENVKFRQGTADFSQTNFTPDKAFDGDRATGWAIDPQEGQPHQIVFVFDKPITHAPGSLLTLRLEQTLGEKHLIGRLRLSCTSAENVASFKVLAPDVNVQISTADPQQFGTTDSLLAFSPLGKVLADEIIAILPPPQKVWAVGANLPKLRNYSPPAEPYRIMVLTRGNINTPATEVFPGGLECVSTLNPDFGLSDPQNEPARRAALATWITDHNNMLTWRSMANRVWHWNFGRGLSESMNDFGHMGTPPSHPELLDWLACELRDHGGSLKALHRIILNSQTYRQECTSPTPQSLNGRIDPRSFDSDNRFLWKQNRRRLDAEQLRDSLLAISGRLDLTMGGPSAMQFNYSDPNVGIVPRVDYIGFDPDSPASLRRSVYRYLFRNQNDSLLEAFDAVDPSLSTPRRNETITPLQSLALYNNRFVLRQCEHLAARLEQQAATPEAHIEFACLLLHGRSPDFETREALVTYTTLYGLANTCRVLINSNDFLFVN